MIKINVNIEERKCDHCEESLDEERQDRDLCGTCWENQCGECGDVFDDYDDLFQSLEHGVICCSDCMTKIEKNDDWKNHLDFQGRVIAVEDRK